MHYLDNAATTQVHPEVTRVIGAALQDCFANPSSLYSIGMQAEQQLAAAREAVARCMGCTPAELVFTASGTEGNNIGILGAVQPRRSWGRHIVATGYEHASVAHPLALLAKQQDISLTWVPPGEDGRVPLGALVEATGPETMLVCAMHCNNETGALLDVAELARRVKEKNPRTAVHVDGVQAFCKIPLELGKTRIDTYAVSGHKLHAPKGIGALYVRRGFHIQPPFTGGAQEHGIRPGTENVPYILGFAAAVQLAAEARVQGLETISRLRATLLGYLAELPGVVLNSPADGWAGIVNFSLPAGVRSQPMLNLLAEQYGVFVSSGSACDKGQLSPTLTAMGLPAARVQGALRVSFTAENTQEDMAALRAGLQAGLQKLARSRN